VCDLEVTGVPSIFKLIRKAVVLVTMLSTFDLPVRCEENDARLRQMNGPDFCYVVLPTVDIRKVHSVLGFRV
jgi:hypothetical protein